MDFKSNSIVGVEIGPMPLVLQCFFLAKQILNTPMASRQIQDLYFCMNLYTCEHTVVVTITQD